MPTPEQAIAAELDAALALIARGKLALAVLLLRQLSAALKTAPHAQAA